MSQLVIDVAEDNEEGRNAGAANRAPYHLVFSNHCQEFQHRDSEVIPH